MAAERSELVRLCRAALEQVARAERFTMAEWLTVRPDGRTMKAAYAEAARLAYELATDMSSAALPESTVVPSAGSTGPARIKGGRDDRALRGRERRPALVLTRELWECLERVLASAERGEPPPARAQETLAAVEALTSPDR